MEQPLTQYITLVVEKMCYCNQPNINMFLHNLSTVQNIHQVTAIKHSIIKQSMTPTTV